MLLPCKQGHAHCLCTALYFAACGFLTSIGDTHGLFSYSFTGFIASQSCLKLHLAHHGTSRQTLTAAEVTITVCWLQSQLPAELAKPQHERIPLSVVQQ